MFTTHYIFSGRTYHNRDYLRDMGATWHPDHKVWTLNGGGNGLEARLVYLRRMGVKVERGTLPERAPATVAPASAGGMIDISNMSDSDLDALLGTA